MVVGILSSSSLHILYEEIIGLSGFLLFWFAVMFGTLDARLLYKPDDLVEDFFFHEHGGELRTINSLY
jgi:hypothetical protein